MLCYRCGSHVSDDAPECPNCGQGFGSGAIDAARFSGSLEALRRRRQALRESAASRVGGGQLRRGDLVGGRYEIRSLVGSGPFGSVYRALDQEIDADVALKVIRADLLSGPDDRERFLTVVRRTRRLSQQNIVRVYDVEEDSETRNVFCTSQYLEGLTLRKVLSLRADRGQHFSLREVEPIVAQICLALQHAHRTAAHGDLKPENVIILPDLLKLTDYFLLDAMPQASFVERQRGIAGEAYIAPELKLGQAPDSRSDVFSLGIILCEMLCGRSVLAAEERPSSVNPALTGAEDELYLRATATDPSQRYRSAEEFSEDVTSVIDTGGVLRGEDLGGMSALEERSDSDDFELDIDLEGAQVVEDGVPSTGLTDPHVVIEDVQDLDELGEVRPFVEPSSGERLPLVPPVVEPRDVSRPPQPLGRSDVPVGVWAAMIAVGIALASYLVVQAMSPSAPPPQAASSAPGLSDSEPKDVETAAPAKAATALAALAVQDAGAEASGADVGTGVASANAALQAASVAANPEQAGGILEERAPVEPLVNAAPAGLPARQDPEDQPVASAETPPEASSLEPAEPPTPIAAPTPIIAPTTARAVPAPMLAGGMPALTPVEAPSPIAPVSVAPKAQAAPDPGTRAASTAASSSTAAAPAATAIKTVPAPSPPASPPPRPPPPAAPPPRPPPPVATPPPPAVATTIVKPPPARVTAPQVKAVSAAPPAKPKTVCHSSMAKIRRGRAMVGSSQRDQSRGFEGVAQRVTTAGYCVDRYEYPGIKGQAPRTAVTLSEARSFCAAKKKRLCTNTEWERACKGPRNLRYPYGHNFNANMCATEDAKEEPRSLGATGSFRRCRSGYGVYDMSGNAAEWTAEGNVRGGSAKKPDYATRCASKSKKSAGARDFMVGFRCCADLE